MLIFGINRHRAWQVVRECVERAGLGDLVNPETGKLRGISPHRLRGARAVHAMKLNDSGDGLRLLQEHLGHASFTFNTTARYRKVAAEKHRQVPFEPNDVLAETVAEALEIKTAQEAVPPPPAPKRSINHFETEIERRVFVAGAYRYGGPNLNDIRRCVEENGCDPVIAADFDIPQGQDHAYSLRLLHLCGKAIFEVTIPGGQLMELERCKDYGIEPLVVRNVLEASEEQAQISAMVATPKKGHCKGLSRHQRASSHHS